MVRPIAGFVTLLLGVSASVVSAHPLHISFTEIMKDSRTGHVAVSVRLFVDDFGRTLDSLAALPSSRGVRHDVVARHYFERSVSLLGPDGKPVALAWCGMHTTDGQTWLCAKSVDPVPTGRMRFANTLMFDRFADQISIVRWTHRAKVKTLVLSARAAEGPLD